MILCDIGNTTYHFKKYKKDFKISIKDDLTKLIKLKGEMYFISVNSKATKKLLDKFPYAIDLETMITFNTQYVGLGLDRKIVCSTINNGIVVDVGSAVTVDIMKNNKHKGGFILPGIGAYKKIYPKISKKLSFKFENDINLAKIPLNTSSAISYAILSSIVLPILKVYSDYNLPIYITGGDSKQILHCFKDIDIRYDKDLIFKSMKRIIKRDKEENKC